MMILLIKKIMKYYDRTIFNQNKSDDIWRLINYAAWYNCFYKVIFFKLFFKKMKCKNIIHITHTNPFIDSRILNISESIDKLDQNYFQYIFGLSRNKLKIKKIKNTKNYSHKTFKQIYPTKF